MVIPYLQDITFTGIVVKTVYLQGVNNINIDKTANVIPIPIPTQTVTATLLYDFLGDAEIVSVSGTAMGEISTVKSFIDSLLLFINGNQQTRKFYSDATGEIIGMIADCTASWNVPGNICDYSFKILVGQGQQVTS